MKFFFMTWTVGGEQDKCRLMAESDEQAIECVLDVLKNADEATPDATPVVERTAPIPQHYLDQVGAEEWLNGHPEAPVGKVPPRDESRANNCEQHY